ncbi:MAG: hypothetical protein K9M03_04555 [Kiritimatiellales bacterium]|nr:hypothetical protein [Kiritimatiellales bacterium]
MDYECHLNWVRQYAITVESLQGDAPIDAVTHAQLEEGRALCDTILQINAASPTVMGLRVRIDSILRREGTPAAAENEPKIWLKHVCIPAIQESTKASTLDPLLALSNSFGAEQDRTDWKTAMDAIEANPPNWQNTWTIADIVNEINKYWCMPRKLLLAMDQIPIENGTFPELNRDNLWFSTISAYRIIRSHEITSDEGNIPVHIIERDEKQSHCGYALNHGFINITEGFSEEMTDAFDESAVREYPATASPDQIQRKLFGQFLLKTFPDKQDRQNAHMNRALLEEIIHYLFAEEIKKGVDFRSMTAGQFWCHAMKKMTPKESQFYKDIQSRNNNPTEQEARDYNDANMARFELAARVAVAATIEHPHYMIHEFGMLMHDNRSYPHYASARLGIMFAGQLFKFPQQMNLTNLSADDIRTLQIFKNAMADKCTTDQLRDNFTMQSNTLFSPRVLYKEPVHSWNKDSARQYPDTRD